MSDGNESGNERWPAFVEDVDGTPVTIRTCPFCCEEFSGDPCFAAALDEIARLEFGIRSLRDALRQHDEDAWAGLRGSDVDALDAAITSCDRLLATCPKQTGG